MKGETDDGLLELSVKDEQSGKEWQVTESRHHLLNEYYTATFNIVAEGFEPAICSLANAGKYIDFSFPPGKQVTVVTKTKHGLQPKDAIVLDWREVEDWKALIEPFKSKKKRAKGKDKNENPEAHVIVALLQKDRKQMLVTRNQIVEPTDKSKSWGKWPKELASLVSAVERTMSFKGEDEDDVSVETTKTVKFDLDEKSEATKSIQDTIEYRALIESLESSNKSICDAYKTLRMDELICFWPEVGFYAAEPLDPTEISLEVLASHFLFTIPGPYCPVHFPDEDADYLVPLSYLRSGRCGSGCKYGLSRICM